MEQNLQLCKFSRVNSQRHWTVKWGRLLWKGKLLSQVNVTNHMFVICIQIRAEKSKSLIRWKRLEGGKRRILFTIRLLAKKYLIRGDVVNPESKAQNNNNVFKN